MIDTKHTPEPWGLYQTENTGLPPDPCPCIVIDTVGKEIPSKNLVVCVITDNESKNERDIANARRIIACVNACAGITTKMLESFSVLHEINESKNKREDTERDAINAHAQRDTA